MLEKLNLYPFVVASF